MCFHSRWTITISPSDGFWRTPPPASVQCCLTDTSITIHHEGKPPTFLCTPLRWSNRQHARCRRWSRSWHKSNHKRQSSSPRLCLDRCVVFLLLLLSGRSISTRLKFLVVNITHPSFFREAQYQVTREREIAKYCNREVVNVLWSNNPLQVQLLTDYKHSRYHYQYALFFVAGSSRGFFFDSNHKGMICL